MKTVRRLVIASHYDRRPVRDLLELIDTMRNHDSGADFDVCVVVNQEVGHQITVPPTPFSLTLLYRPNTGMNIGAWDYGWRAFPDYEEYIFLQDECRIRRDGWVRSITDFLQDPSVGIVGECINHRWSRPWDELTAIPTESSRDANALNTSKRALLCLDLLQSRNVPPGDNARHLRSLVWAFSREVLHKLNGFPIGQDYDECIAAEIAVSRHVEALGLSIRQIHDLPFYYISHTQWTNTYPGFSASLNYSDWARKQFANLAVPFNSLTGKGDSEPRVSQLTRRVEAERGIFDSGVYPAPRCGFVALLVVLVDRPPSHKDCAATTLSWCLQSAPFTDILFVVTDDFFMDRMTQWVGHKKHTDFAQVKVISLCRWSEVPLERYEFVLFARPGDQFHPSAAAVLAILGRSEQADIIVWNECRTRRADSEFFLLWQPELEPITIGTVGHIGTAFAARPCKIKQFPYDFLNDVLINDGYIFHLWLSRQPGVQWVTHPEFLCSRLLEDSSYDVRSPLNADDVKAKYLDVVGEDSELTLTAGSTRDRCQLSPVAKARSISVIVSFRDRASETIVCIRSVLRQRVSGQLELIMIDNLSGKQAREEIESAVREWQEKGFTIKLIDYAAAFNHSRQTNLGVRASSGQVLIFLNNDAELMSPTLLEEMSAWALLADVGTVGCQMVGERSQLLSAGIRARERWDGLTASPVEESAELAFRNEVREVLGNTFACAAIDRSKFEKVGCLNETEFPNGYNDVEYSMRVRRQGYRNVYVGHLKVKHTPGTSRGRSDETFQKILLKRRFPELAVSGMFLLSNQSLNGTQKPGSEGSAVPATSLSSFNPSHLPPSTSLMPDEAPVGMKKALRMLGKAMVYWTQRRILRGRGL